MKGKNVLLRRMVVSFVAIIMLCAIIPMGLGSAMNPGKVYADGAPPGTEAYYSQKWKDCILKWESNPMTANGWTKLETVRTEDIWTGNNSPILESVPEADGYYHVSTANQLRGSLKKAEASSNSAVKIKLINDIDLNGVEGHSWGSLVLNAPLEIEGQNHIISNLLIAAPHSTGGISASVGTGFIDRSSKNITVNNLHFKSVKIKGEGNTALFPVVTAGAVLNMDNCSVEDGLIEGGGCVGVLSAYVSTELGAGKDSKIKNSYTKNCYVYGDSHISNFVTAYTGTLENCYALDGVVISTGGHSGGMASCAGHPAIFKKCFTNVTVYGNQDTGVMYGQIQDNGYVFEECYTSGIIEGNQSIGGFIGSYSSNYDAKFTDCYSTSMVGMDGGGANLGGFVGLPKGSTGAFVRCYAAGEVGSLSTVLGKNTIGGFSGNGVNTYTNCFYDKQTSAAREYGVSGYNGNYKGVKGLTTLGLTGSAAEKNTGFVEEKWDFKEGLYPQLRAFTDDRKLTGILEKNADLVKAYSAASASTAFLRDYTQENPNRPSNLANAEDYDTVRDINQLFDFTSKAKTNGGHYFWQKDKNHPDQVKSPIIPDMDVLNITSAGVNDRVSNLAPGIGWARVDATIGNQMGNRAMRFIPTSVLSLDTANPDMGIGSDYQIYPKLDKNPNYMHKEGVNFVKATAEQLAAYDKNNPLTHIPYGRYFSDDYKDVPVVLVGSDGADLKDPSDPTGYKTQGKVNLEISKETLDYGSGTKSADDITTNGDRPGTGTRTNQEYQKLFNGTMSFTENDYGIYTLKYTWTIPEKGDQKEVTLTNSKKVYVLPALEINYNLNYKDKDNNDAGYHAQTYHRYNSTVVDRTIEDSALGVLEFKLPENPVPPSGYTFKGWSTKLDKATEESFDEKEAFKVGSKVTDDIANKTLDIYAVWERRGYTLKFDNNAGKITGKNDAIIEEETIDDIRYTESVKDKDPSQFPEALAVGERYQVEGISKVFLGWSTKNPYDESGKQTVFNGNFDVSTPIIEGDKEDPNNPLKDFDFRTLNNNEITVYPVFAVATGTVNFYDNKDTTLEAPQSGGGLITDAVCLPDYNTEITKPTAPSWDTGHVFLGWSKDKHKLYPPKGAGEAFVEGLPEGTRYDGKEAVINYYAVWRDNTYKVNAFIEKRQTAEDSLKATAYYGETTPLPDLSERLYYTDADTNQKYHFTGWQNKNAVNETEKTIKPVYNVNDLGDGHVLNIEAQYEKVYDVIFHQKNEASSGIFESITITEGQAMGTKFPKEHPLLESKTFVGWTKIPGGTSVDPSITKESIITENTDYYPVYKEADGTITFKMNDGSGKNFGNPAGIAYNDLITRPAENPVWPGYDFMGWSDKAEKVLEKDQTFDDLLGEGNTLRYDGEHENIDYFAVWRMHPYTLDFIVRPDRPGDPHIKIEDIPYGTEIGNKMPKDPAGYTDEKGQKYQFSHWVDEKKNHVDQNTHYTVDQITNDKEIITAVYNKVYDVTGTKYGHGNIKSGTGTFVEGSRTTVFWEPDAGYRVTKVMVDYRVRDDLLASGKGGSITFDPITENHRIHVEFSKKDDGGEDETIEEYCTVLTRKTGGSDNCFLSPTRSFKADGTASTEIKWNAAIGYHVKRVILDGTGYPITDNGTISLAGLRADHQVEVVFEADESMGGSSTPGFYTITTNQIGGDPTGQATTLTPSSVTTGGKDHRVHWSAVDPYSIDCITIDQGTKHEKVLTQNEIIDGNFVFGSVDRDHTVNVVYKRASNPDDPKPKESVNIVTSLVGGPGEITSSATLEKGSDYHVAWKLPPEIAEPEGVYYNYYVIDKILINGEEQDTQIKDQDFRKLDSDQEIKVVLKPNLYDINTLKGGKGYIAPSTTLFYGENYCIDAHPEEGWYLKTVEIDGVKIAEYDDPKADINPEIRSAMRLRSSLADEISDPSIEGNNVTIPVDGITMDHKVKVVFAKEGEPVIDEESLHTVTAHIENGPGTITGQGLFESGESTIIAWNNIPKEYEIDQIIVKADGIERPDIAEKATNGALDISDIQEDYDVTVYLKRIDNANTTTDPGEDGDEQKETYTINTTIRKGEGTITEAIMGISKGEDRTVEWRCSEGYEVKEVWIDGQRIDELKDLNQYIFKEIDTNHNVEVILQEKDTTPKPEHSITIKVGGDADGIITILDGESHTVTWKPEEGKEVDTIIIDGIERPDLIGEDHYTFNEITKDHSITVTYKPKKESVADHIIKTSNAGNGSITAEAIIKNGNPHTVVWTPAPGYKVGRVEVDGVNRPDLLDAGQLEYGEVTANHHIHVIFELIEEDGEDEGGGEDSEDPPKDNGTSGEKDPPIKEDPNTNNNATEIRKPIDEKPSEKLNLARWDVSVSGIAPLTGIREQRDGGHNGVYPALENIFKKGQKSDALCLADMLAAAGIVVLALASMLLKKRGRMGTVIIALTSLLLFFITQPMILHFQIIDQYTPLFLLLLIVASMTVWCIGKKKEKERETR